MPQRTLLPSFEFNQQATTQISTTSFPAIPSNDITLYAVFALDNQVTAGQARICRISGGAADVFFFLSVTDEYPTFNNGASTCQLASAVAPQTPVVVSGVGRTGDSQVYKNGVGSALGTTDPSGNTGTALTMGSQGGSNCYPGAIAALLVFSNAHTDAERQQVERWLGDVYDIAVA